MQHVTQGVTILLQFLCSQTKTKNRFSKSNPFTSIRHFDTTSHNVCTFIYIYIYDYFEYFLIVGLFILWNKLYFLLCFKQCRKHPKMTARCVYIKHLNMTACYVLQIVAHLPGYIMWPAGTQSIKTAPLFRLSGAPLIVTSPQAACKPT
jgi:hypothetical protein